MGLNKKTNLSIMGVNEHQFSLTWWFHNPSDFPCWWLGFSDPLIRAQRKIGKKNV